MAGVLELAGGALPEADPVVLPKERATDPDTVRGALQRIMSSDCGVVRDADGLEVARGTLGDLARLADDLPARSIASYEVIDLLRVSRAIVASAAARTGIARRAHPPGIPGSLRLHVGPLRVARHGGPGVRRAAGRSGPGPAMTSFDPPRSAVRQAVENALAEDLGILGDITSLACIDDDQRAEAVFAARADGVLAGTALATETLSPTRFRCAGGVAGPRRRIDRRGCAPRPGVGLAADDPHRRTHGVELLVPLLGHGDDDAPLRHGGARSGSDPRHAQDAPRAPRRTARRGACRRRLQPPRLSERRGVDQGQPSRGERARKVGRSGRDPRGPVGSSRSSAIPSSRSPKRTTPRSTACSSTT